MKKFLLTTAVLTLTGCAAPPNSYIPQLSGTLPAKVKVAPFIVEPKVTGASGFAEWEKLYYTDSIRIEFQNLNAYDDAAPCTLTGSIDRLSTAGGAPTIHAEIDVSFNLLNRHGDSAYKRSATTTRELPPEGDMVGFVTILNRMTADTLRQLTKDAGFTNALSRNCR